MEEPQFRCFMMSGDQTEPKEEILFRQDPAKKSSFHLNSRVVNETPKPAHLVIEYRSNSSRSLPFFLGGFQLVSNAKNVEVYLTEEKSGKESYLMTCKGIFFEEGENGEQWLKILSVVPGGPRAVTRLHIKLLSLQPKDEASGRLASLKITARLPKVEAQPELNTPTSGQSNNFAPNASVREPSHASSAANGSIPLTQADLGAAMASMSMMARATEDSVTKAMATQFQHLEQNLEAKWTRTDQHIISLTSVVVSQKAVLEERSRVLEQQQATIKKQAEQINTLLEQQRELLDLVRDIRRDSKGESNSDR